MNEQANFIKNELALDINQIEIKKFEYEMAQRMLMHYDSLNWQIGSILIAAVIIMTGFVLKGDLIAKPIDFILLRFAIAFALPIFSLFILIVWILWFRRHRDLYNLRNEVLYRIEVQLGMYHFLRVVEAVGSQNKTFAKLSDDAKLKAGHDSKIFAPICENNLSRPSGYKLAWILAIGVPIGQFILLLMFLAMK
jgi:hypothetical protein